MTRTYFAFFLATLLLASSCTILPPTYKKVENFKYESLGTAGFKFGTDVVFHNPNKLKFKITHLDMNVIVDGKKIAALNQNEMIAVNRKSDFNIPLKVTVKPEMTLLEALQKAADLVGKRKLDLMLGGTVEVKWFIFKKQIPLNMKETVKF